MDANSAALQQPEEVSEDSHISCGEAASSSDNEDNAISVDDIAQSTTADPSKLKQKPGRKKGYTAPSLAERASKAADCKKLASLRLGTAKNLIVPHLQPSESELASAVDKARATSRANSSITPLLEVVIARLVEGFSDDECALIAYVRQRLMASGASEVEIADVSTVVNDCCKRKFYCDCSVDATGMCLSGWEVVDNSLFGFSSNDFRLSCVSSLRKLRCTIGDFVQNLAQKHDALVSQDFSNGALKGCEKELSRIEKKRESEQKQWDANIQKVVDKFKKDEESKVAAASKALAKSSAAAPKTSSSKPAAAKTGAELFASMIVPVDNSAAGGACPTSKAHHSSIDKESTAASSAPKATSKSAAKCAPPAPPSKSIAMFFKKVDKPADIDAVLPSPVIKANVTSNDTVKSPTVPAAAEILTTTSAVTKSKARLSRFMPWNTPNFTIMAPHPYGPFEGSEKRVFRDAATPGDLKSWIRVFKAGKIVPALAPVTVDQDESGEPGGVTLRKRLIHHASVMVDGEWFSAIRPAYYGVVLRSAPSVTSRRPFAQDKCLDYDYNSEDEWSDEEDGETINSCDEDEEVDDDDDLDDGFVDDEFDAGKNLPTAKLIPQVIVYSDTQVDASLSAYFAELCTEWFETDPLECDANQDEDDETAGSKRTIAKIAYRKEWDAAALLQLVAVIHNSQSRDDFVEKFQALIPDFAKATIQGKINEMQGTGIVSRHKPGPDYRKVWRVHTEFVQKAVDAGHVLIPDSECLCKKADKKTVDPSTPDGESGKRGREGEEDALSSKRTAPHVTLEQCFNRPEGLEPMLSVKPQILQEHLEKEERESNEKAEKFKECKDACQRFIQSWSLSSEKTFLSDLGQFVSSESSSLPQESGSTWKHFSGLLDAVVYCVVDFSFSHCEPAEQELSLKSGKALTCFMHALTVAAAAPSDSENYLDLVSSVQAAQKSLGEALRKRSFRSLFLKNLENKGTKMASYWHRLFVFRIATFVHLVGFDISRMVDSALPLDDSLRAARDHMRRDFASEATLKMVYDTCYDGSLGTWVQAFDSNTGLMNSLIPSLLVCLSTVPVDSKLGSSSALTQIALLACECTMVKANLKRSSIFSCVDALLSVICNRYTMNEKELAKLLKSTSLNILLERCKAELLELSIEKEKVARARQLVLDRRELLAETREIDAQDKLCNWYQAFLISQCALTCTVHFVGWESKFDETIPVRDMEHRIRERTSTAPIGKLGQEERPPVQPRTYEDTVVKGAKDIIKAAGDPLCCFDKPACSAPQVEISSPVTMKCCLDMMILILNKNLSIQRKGGLYWTSQDTTFLSEILRFFVKVLSYEVGELDALALKGLAVLPDTTNAPSPIPKVLKAMQADQLIKGDELNCVRTRSVTIDRFLTWLAEATSAGLRQMSAAIGLDIAPPIAVQPDSETTASSALEPSTASSPAIYTPPSWLKV